MLGVNCKENHKIRNGFEVGKKENPRPKSKTKTKAIRHFYWNFTFVRWNNHRIHPKLGINRAKFINRISIVTIIKVVEQKQTNNQGTLKTI